MGFGIVPFSLISMLFAGVGALALDTVFHELALVECAIFVDHFPVTVFAALMECAGEEGAIGVVFGALAGL